MLHRAAVLIVVACCVRAVLAGEPVVDPNSAHAYDSLAEACAKAALWKEAADASDRAAALATEHGIANRDYFVEAARKARERLEQESAKSP